MPDTPDNSLSIPAYLRELTTLVCALLRDNGELVEANRGFVLLAQREHSPGVTWNAASLFINPTFSQLLASKINGNIAYRGILNIGHADSVAHSVHGTVYRDGHTLLLVAEPDMIELSGLNRSVLSLNEEMAEMGRDLQRKNKQLLQAQGQLLQAGRMASAGQLAAGIAHEINNPVGFALSNLGSLDGYIRDMFAALELHEKSGVHLPASQLAGLRAALAALDLVFLRSDIPALLEETRDGLLRVKNIVQSLQDFSRPDSGSDRQWVKLQHCLDTTLEMAAHSIKDKAEVIREYAEQPEIECHPALLNQMFLSLLLNAAQAIENHGVITLRSGAGKNNVWVEICDNGAGIAPEHLKHIFDPFFTTRPVGQGTGLGLSLVHSIIEQHHGRIEVDSEAGKGSCFRITLPIQQPAKT